MTTILIRKSKYSDERTIDSLERIRRKPTHFFTFHFANLTLILLNRYIQMKCLVSFTAESEMIFSKNLNLTEICKNLGRL